MFEIRRFVMDVYQLKIIFSLPLTTFRSSHNVVVMAAKCIHSFSIPSDDKLKASSKTIPSHSAI